MPDSTLSKSQRITLFSGTIIFGFLLFVLPNLFFGISKINGGLVGINLLFTALFQLVSVVLLLRFSLRKRGWNWQQIGLAKPTPHHIFLGLAAAIFWLSVQFLWLIPSTGGETRADVQQMISMMDSSMLNIFYFMCLGVIGGGITEELYNRGYFIKGMQDLFKNQKIGLVVASISSILFFVLGHLPTDFISWVDILIPTILYTILFITTGKLTAPIIAHSIYNAIAIVLVNILYL